MHSRHHRRFIVLEGRIIRQVPFEFPNEKSRRASPNDKYDRASCENETKETGYMPHASKPFEFRKLLPGEISKTAVAKSIPALIRQRPLCIEGRRLAILTGSFVASNAGIVVFFMRRFYVENLSNETMIASSACAKSLYGFVFSYDLIKKLCNFLGSCSRLSLDTAANSSGRHHSSNRRGLLRLARSLRAFWAL
jgi:hypothetical protein